MIPLLPGSLWNPLVSPYANQPKQAGNVAPSSDVIGQYRNMLGQVLAGGGGGRPQGPQGLQGQPGKGEVWGNVIRGLLGQLPQATRSYYPAVKGSAFIRPETMQMLSAIPQRMDESERESARLQMGAQAAARQDAVERARLAMEERRANLEAEREAAKPTWGQEAMAQFMGQALMGQVSQERALALEGARTEGDIAKARTLQEMEDASPKSKAMVDYYRALAGQAGRSGGGGGGGGASGGAGKPLWHPQLGYIVKGEDGQYHPLVNPETEKGKQKPPSISWQKNEETGELEPYKVVQNEAGDWEVAPVPIRRATADDKSVDQETPKAEAEKKEEEPAFSASSIAAQDRALMRTEKAERARTKNVVSPGTPRAIPVDPQKGLMDLERRDTFGKKVENVVPGWLLEAVKAMAAKKKKPEPETVVAPDGTIVRFKD